MDKVTPGGEFYPKYMQVSTWGKELIATSAKPPYEIARWRQRELIFHSFYAKIIA
jgi:hypothetical protein